MPALSGSAFTIDVTRGLTGPQSQVFFVTVTGTSVCERFESLGIEVGQLWYDVDHYANYQILGAFRQSYGLLRMSLTSTIWLNSLRERACRIPFARRSTSFALASRFVCLSTTA